MSRCFEAFGHRVDFEIREGVADAPSVLLVHGLTGDRALLLESCEPVLARRGLRRIYFDLPGHGSSTGDTAYASADHLVATIGRLVAATCPTPPLVVGYSYGGYLAQGLARDLELRGLFLVCPVIEPDLGKRSRPARRLLRRDPDLLFGDDHERETFEEVAVMQVTAVLETYRRVVAPASRAAHRAFVEAVRARYAMSRPYVDALARFERPVGVVCGRHDHWVGFEDAVRLAHSLDDASVSIVARSGQLLPIEAPARFQEALEEWLDRALG